MRLIRLLVAVSLPTFLGAVAAGIAGGVALTATIALVNYALSALLWQRFDGATLAAGTCGIVASVAWLTYLSANTVSVLMQRSLATLRGTLCERVLDSRLAQAEAHGQSALVALFTDDLGRVAQGAFALPVLVVNLSVCVAACIYLGSVHPALCGVVLATQAAGMGVTAACFGRFNRAARVAMQERHALVANYHLLTGAIKELKQSVDRREAFRHELFDPNVKGALHASQHVNRLGNTMDAIAKAGFLLTIATIFVLAAALPGLVSATELRSVVVGFIFMATPLAAALNTAPQLLEANAALQRIESLDLGSEPAPRRTTPDADSVGLADACFSYAGAAGGFRCGPLSLSLRRGEIVALTGGNGSGKTTAAKCLAGLYALEAGRFMVDGQVMAGAAATACRELFTVVWSENTLNRHHLPARARAAGRAAWTLLGLDDVAPFATGWFDCSAMSTGQRRRVALAAALMDARPFFILDEWSANQDKDLRELFYTKLLPQLRAGGHGVLLITHDAMGVRSADRTLRMEDGVIAAARPTPAAALATPLRPVQEMP
jgi:ABC-type siderophore export system fused ATPase/permease subunit